MTASAASDPRECPVTSLKGVGPKVAQRLERLGIHNVQDVLFHLPSGYQDRTRVVPMGSLRPGDRAVVVGEVRLTEVQFRGRRALLTNVHDGTGSLTLRFFHFNAAQQHALARGVRLRCFGEVRKGRAGLEMIHPEWSVESEAAPRVDAHLTPIYPATEGVHQLTLRGLSEQALQHADFMRELLPDELIPDTGFPPLAESIRFLHRPPPEASLEILEAGTHPAQRRLAFEELLAHHLSLRKLREASKREPAPPMDPPGELLSAFISGLPFKLTGAQARVIEQLRTDLKNPHPMQRLVQGDVGSGKTVVAAAAVVLAVEAGYQVAVMAPTELLAEQHLRNFTAWLEPLGLTPVWLAGSLKGKAKRQALEDLASGEARVAVGTHALFQEQVVFAHLGLVVIDEQHRFGVHQRLALREKGALDGKRPHQLIMTATPIPRTLAMTFYADLDSSVIDELPPGRTPVTTVALADNRRVEVVERVHRACQQGRQVYWVCTLIEESETLQCEAAEDTFKQLADALPEQKIGLVHGRMKATDKEAAMRAFKAGDIDLLVATTVIEVGVDVPNASLMVIENAERLGLSQLHQLRGRVGRGTEKSSCVLLYRPPLSGPARVRLTAMRETNDGFEIARRDLELRGPGELLGTRQTGDVQFKLADLLRDQAMLPAIESAAERILRQYPERVEALLNRWLGDTTRYGNV